MEVANEKRENIRDIIQEAQDKIRLQLKRPVTILYTIKVNDISENHIVQATLKETQTRWSDIVSEKRNREYMVPRKIIAWLCSRYLGYGTVKIGRILEVDHSSVVRYLEDMDNMIDTDDELYIPPLKNIEASILKLVKS